MIKFSRGIRPTALADMRRLAANSNRQAQANLYRYGEVLLELVRHDPHLIGDSAPTDERLRRLRCGSLTVLYELRPLEDRYVEVTGFIRNQTES